MPRSVVTFGDRTGSVASGFRPGLFCAQTTKEANVQAAASSVLTVEDNPIVRADLRLVLEDAGFTVVADARDGIEAIELTRVHRPDVIVLDLGLPRLDGVQTTQRILAECSIPIVALTGRSRSLAEDALEAGATSYVLKPFSGADVVTAVRDALAGRRLDVRGARAESRRSISVILELCGYPPEWAIELEQRAWDNGRLWRETPRTRDR
jgi:CheY-like chemotaxis protein